jgi:hypothetical protein
VTETAGEPAAANPSAAVYGTWRRRVQSAAFMDKARWFLTGCATTVGLLFVMESPWPMWVYTAVGLAVTAVWFWQEDDNVPGPRRDVAIATPFLAMLWPALTLALPFMGAFRTPVRVTDPPGKTAASRQGSKSTFE